MCKGLAEFATYAANQSSDLHRRRIAQTHATWLDSRVKVGFDCVNVAVMRLNQELSLLRGLGRPRTFKVHAFVTKAETEITLHGKASEEDGALRAVQCNLQM